MRLTEKELRALVLLSKEPAHELIDDPLSVLLALKKAGLCRVTRLYQDRRRGRIWNYQVVEITQAGIDYLRSVRAIK